MLLLLFFLICHQLFFVSSNTVSLCAMHLYKKSLQIIFIMHVIRLFKTKRFSFFYIFISFCFVLFNFAQRRCLLLFHPITFITRWAVYTVISSQCATCHTVVVFLRFFVDFILYAIFINCIFIKNCCLVWIVCVLCVRVCAPVLRYERSGQSIIISNGADIFYS